MVDLQTSRNPNVEHADVDCSDEYGREDHDLSREFAVRNNDTDTVDDDLKEELDLDTPPEN